jgi:hypothetical protein
VVGIAAAWPAVAQPATGQGDFNGDGFADLAIGVVAEAVGSVTDAGAVNVIYGSATGLSAAGDQFWHQDVAGVTDAAEPDDRFGRAVAAADFDGDGFCDLAVGVPGEDVGGRDSAGAVHVFYGSAAGLTAARDRLWHQNSTGIAGTPGTFDAFGLSLVAANFGRSARADLAVGVQGERVGGRENAGAVNVLYGGARGLSATGNQLWHQNTPGIGGSAEVGDLWGRTLAAANFGRSGHADLVVGVEGESVGAISSAGAVNVIYGSSNGLTAARDQVWHENSPGVTGVAEFGDEFGTALAAADFGRSGYADLAVGVPDQDVAGLENAGAVIVLYGTREGLSAAGDQRWTQNSTDIEDSAETRDTFGITLVAANFGQGSDADLAVTAAEETIGAATQAGAVHVIYGGPSGLSSSGDQFWSQDSTDVEDVAETEDYLGDSLGAGNFGNGPQADLAIGSPAEDVGALADAGAVNVLYGSTAGLTATGDQFWFQGAASGLADAIEAGDNFGTALAPRR